MHRPISWGHSAALLGVLLGPANLWATNGWELLGTRRVSFAADRGVIEVTAKDGRFNALRIQVDGGNLEMFNIRVVFANGREFSPDIRLMFGEGERSRTIDLPGEARLIRRIEFRYRGRVGRGEATVKVFGRQAGENDKTPNGEAGWDHLGTRQVDFRGDRDFIAAAGEGAFRQIRIVVDGGDLEMHNIKVTFANGESFSPETRLIFQDDSRSRLIELPGELRVIRNIEFTYRSVPGGREGRATIHLYGRKK